MKRIFRFRAALALILALALGFCVPALAAGDAVSPSPEPTEEPAPEIRFLSYEEALTYFDFTTAATNWCINFGMDPAKLYVSEVYATPGPILKRMMPRAQGRAYRINKRTSHVTLAVAERD